MTARIAGCALLALLALVPFVVRSEFWLTTAMLVLLFAFLGQAWNVLGGYGGQFSFGHALFFGAGAYATALLQVRHGVNAWAGATAAMAFGAVVLHALGEAAKHVTGGAPGLNLVLYGVLLVLALRFLPNGISGLARR